MMRMESWTVVTLKLQMAFISNRARHVTIIKESWSAVRSAG